MFTFKPQSMENKSQPQTPEEIIAALKSKGVTCKSCWWQEGGRCYNEPCERIPNPEGFGSISTKMADAICEHHTSKRSVLSQFFSSDMLTIQSEENAKKEGDNSGNY